MSSSSSGRALEMGVICEVELSDDEVLTAILEEAGKLSADLIVLGSRGRTGLPHLLLGSVAERVVRLATCPVLTVKAHKSADDTSKAA
jgi:nucleotide-binding universal stress UspA family protein